MQALFRVGKVIKGQNFAIACEQYGEKDKISVLQFVGGRNGSFIQQVLQEKGIHQICGT